jgi:hypothetical protein
VAPRLNESQRRMPHVSILRRGFRRRHIPPPAANISFLPSFLPLRKALHKSLF